MAPDTLTTARVSRRVRALAESATLAIDARAKAMRAQGEDVIAFGAGEPDFPTPAHIVEEAVRACGDPSCHHYSPVGGLPELRAAIAAKTARDSGLEVDASQVVVTNGGKQAIFNAFATLLDPGDEVLLVAPYWVTYPESIALASGVVVPVRTDESTGFRASVDQLEAARTERTKALVHVSPSNPTGAVYPREEVEAIGRWVQETGLWVLADEIYEHLVYAGREAVSMPAACPALRERCVVVNGVAKTYAMTGWRVGWLIAPPDLARAATNFQSHQTANVCNVAQRAALVALSGDLSAVAAMREAFDRRRLRIWEMLNDIPGVSCEEPHGAFYAFPNMSGLLGRSFGGRRPATTLELAEVILEQAKVAIVPGEAFGAPGYARLSYALSDDHLVEGVARIARLVGTSNP